MSAQLSAFEPGDLVWAHVRGYPRWPGQVADNKLARQRHLSLQKPNTLLVFFFGDRSFGWFGADMLEPFQDQFDKYSKQKAKNQNFKRAVEEGKEVLDKRAGHTPKTKHYAWDYLDKDDERNEIDYDPEAAAAAAAASAAASSRIDIRPQDIDADTARAADLKAALAWILSAARDPLKLCKADDEKIQEDPKARLVFGLSRVGCVQHVDSGDKRPPGRPPGFKTKAPKQSPSLAADLESQDEQPPQKKRKFGSNSNDVTKEENQEENQEEEEDQEARDAAESLEAVKKAAHKARRAERKVELLAEREEQQALSEAQKHSDAADAWQDAADAWQEEVALMEERGAENVNEELDVDLGSIQTAVLNLARSPLSFLDGRVGTAAAAALRFREAAWCMSCLRTDGVIGDCLLRVLGCESGYPTSVKFKRLQEGKARTRMPQSIRMPDLEAVSTKVGDGYMFMSYEGLIPKATPQQFLDRLAAFFEDNGARLSPKVRMAKGSPLDLSRLFYLVARQGGYQAVTATRGWRTIAQELIAPEGPITSGTVASVRMQYQKLLLAYENKLCLDGEAEGDMFVIYPRRREHTKTKKALPTPTRKTGPLAAKRTKRLHHMLGPHEAPHTGGSSALEDCDSNFGYSGTPSESDSEDSPPLRFAATARKPTQGNDSFKAENGDIRPRDFKAEIGVKKRMERVGASATPKAVDLEWKRQSSKRRAAMMSDFDSLEGPSPAGICQGGTLAVAPHSAGTTPSSATMAVMLRPKQDDLKTTIVLRFPPGYPLPSRAQLLLAGTNSGPLDSSQVVVIPQRYMALIHYSNAEDARKAEVWFPSAAHSQLRVAPNEVLSVSREVRKGDGGGSGGKRPGHWAHPTGGPPMQHHSYSSRAPRRPVARRPTPQQAGPRTGVPFQPQPHPLASQEVVDFAGDSSGYNAGGSTSISGQLLGTTSSPSGGSHGVVGVDPRRLLQDNAQHAPQLPAPVDPRRSTMNQHTSQLHVPQQSLSSGWPQHQPHHPGMFMQQPQRPLSNNYGGVVIPQLQSIHPGQGQLPGSHFEAQLHHPPHHVHQLPPQGHQLHQTLPHLQQRQHHQLPWPHARPQPGPPAPPQPAFGRLMPATMLAAGMPGSAGLITSGVPNDGQPQRPIAPSPTHSLASTVDLAAILRSVQPARSGSPAPIRHSSEGEPPPPASTPQPTSLVTTEPALTLSSTHGESNSGTGSGALTIGSDLQDLLLQLGGN